MGRGQAFAVGAVGDAVGTVGGRAKDEEQPSGGHVPDPGRSTAA